MWGSLCHFPHIPHNRMWLEVARTVVTLRTPRPWRGFWPPLIGDIQTSTVFAVDEVTEHRKHLPTPREVTVRFSKAKFSPCWRPKPRNPWRWGKGLCQQQSWTQGSGGSGGPQSAKWFSHIVQNIILTQSRDPQGPKKAQPLKKENSTPSRKSAS